MFDSEDVYCSYNRCNVTAVETTKWRMRSQSHASAKNRNMAEVLSPT